MPLMFFGCRRNFWKMPHSPWPVVAPNDAGCKSDMSNTTAFALATAFWFARSIAFGRVLGFSFRLPVATPPCFAHAAAAAGVARNFTNALTAGVSRKVTNRSPEISTAPALAPAAIDGNGVTLKPLPAFAFVELRMTPATKSPSNTIAAFGGLANVLVTESLKLYCSAPLVPPATLAGLPTIWLMYVSAFLTLGSVHLVLCEASELYFAT